MKSMLLPTSNLNSPVLPGFSGNQAEIKRFLITPNVQEVIRCMGHPFLGTP